MNISDVRRISGTSVDYELSSYPVWTWSFQLTCHPVVLLLDISTEPQIVSNCERSNRELADPLFWLELQAEAVKVEHFTSTVVMWKRSFARWRFAFAIALSTAVATSSSRAAPVAVVNPGFENVAGEVAFNEFTFGPLNGWDLYDPTGVADQGDGPVYYIGTLTPFVPDPVGSPGVFANFPAGSPEGERVAIAFNFAGSGGQGEYGLVQTLAETLQPNMTYTLQVEIGNIASATAMNNEFFPLDGFPGYRVDLLAGGEILAQDDNSLLGSIEDGEFATSTVQIEIGAEHPQLGEALGIRLVNLNQIDPAFPESDIEVDFDFVRLDASTFSSGDFDQDGDVDGDDLLSWQRDFAAMGDAVDLTAWLANFAAPPNGTISAVPESASLTLALACLPLTLKRGWVSL